jgi:hypothetical protein
MLISEFFLKKQLKKIINKFVNKQPFIIIFLLLMIIRIGKYVVFSKC